MTKEYDQALEQFVKTLCKIQQYRYTTNPRDRRSKDADEHMQIGQEIGWYVNRIETFKCRPKLYFRKQFGECVQKLGSELYLDNILECYNNCLEETLNKYPKLKQ